MNSQITDLNSNWLVALFFLFPMATKTYSTVTLIVLINFSNCDHLFFLLSLKVEVCFRNVKAVDIYWKLLINKSKFKLRKLTINIFFLPSSISRTVFPKPSHFSLVEICTHFISETLLNCYSILSLCYQLRGKMARRTPPIFWEEDKTNANSSAIASSILNFFYPRTVHFKFVWNYSFYWFNMMFINCKSCWIGVTSPCRYWMVLHSYNHVTTEVIIYCDVKERTTNQRRHFNFQWIK